MAGTLQRRRKHHRADVVVGDVLQEDDFRHLFPLLKPVDRPAESDIQRGVPVSREQTPKLVDSQILRFRANVAGDIEPDPRKVVPRERADDFSEMAYGMLLADAADVHQIIAVRLGERNQGGDEVVNKDNLSLLVAVAPQHHGHPNRLPARIFRIRSKMKCICRPSV